jgi:WD40 repeat protein
MNGSSSNIKFKYDGFISYSRRADGDLAPKLQDALEQLAKPWNKRRALKIFQDIDDLAANPDLETTLRHELIGSHTMVYLASEESARSKWCADELDFFITERPGSQLVVVLTNGTMQFDKDREYPILFETSTAAPPAFAKLTAVPLYIDMTYTDAEVARLDHRTDPEFRSKATKIAAALHSNRTGTEIEPRDIDSRDLAEHLKARRLRRLALILLTLLTIAAVVAAVVADQQRRTAERLTAEATSRAHAANALAVIDTEPDVAAMLALEATRFQAPAEARRALFAAAGSPWRATLPLPYTGSVAVFSHDGERLAINDSQSPVWDLEKGGWRSDFGAGGWGEVTSLSFNDDSSLLVAGGPGGAFVRDDTGHTVATLTTEIVRSVEFSSDGSLIVGAGTSGATVWDTSGHVVAQIDAGDIRGAVFDPAASRVLTIGVDGFVIWDLDGSPLVELGSATDNGVDDDIPVSAAFSGDGQRIVTAADERVLLWSDTGELIAAFSAGSAELTASGDLANRVSTVAFDDDTNHIVSAGASGTVVWTVENGSRVELPTGPTLSASYSRDGTQIVTVSVSVAVVEPPCRSQWCSDEFLQELGDGSGGLVPVETDLSALPTERHRVMVWEPNADEALALAPSPDASPYTSASFSSDGTHLVTTDPNGATVWDRAGNEIADEAGARTVAAALDFDGSRLFIATGDGPFALTSIDLADEGRRQVLTDSATGPPVVDDSGARLAVATGAGVVIWDLTAGRTPVELKTLDIAAQERIAFNRDWTRLVTAVDLSGARPVDGFDGFVEFVGGPQLFDGDGEYLDGLPDIETSAEALDSTGSRLATVSDDIVSGGVKLWKIPNDGEGVLLTREQTGSVAFDPSGTRVVTANDDGVAIWDVRGAKLAMLTTTRATHAEFSRDGRFLVATLDDGVGVWRTRADSELRTDLERRLGYRGVSYDDVRAHQGQNVRRMELGWKLRIFTDEECQLYRIDLCSLEFAE